MAKKIGAPTKYMPDFHPEDYITRSKLGKCKMQIASAWEVHPDTIYEWMKKHKEFSDAVRMGEVHLANWYMQLGQSSIMGKAMVNGVEVKLNNFNLGSFTWMTKNILKWSDKVENTVEHSGEIKSTSDRKESMRQVFKTEKSRALALELAEEMEAQYDKEQEKKDGKN